MRCPPIQAPSSFSHTGRHSLSFLFSELSVVFHQPSLPVSPLIFLYIMYISTPFITILAAASTTQALQLSDVQTSALEAKRALGGLVSGLVNTLTNRQDTCPPVWNEISTTLTAQFLADGQCTDAARAAIRGSFHDCFNGACDGSLILANECSNTENRGLERLCGNLSNLANEKKVGVADLIQFAAGRHSHSLHTRPLTNSVCKSPRHQDMSRWPHCPCQGWTQRFQHRQRPRCPTHRQRTSRRPNQALRLQGLLSH
jgi:hypothetical protein